MFSTVITHRQHRLILNVRQEPRNLGFIGERQRASPLPPSLSPEPVDNVAQARALGSHLPHASSDVTHTNRVLTPRRRRRNTIPSVAVSDKDAGRISTLTNSPSRPPRERFTGRDEDVFEDRLKRRSRSADALNEMIGMASGVQPKPARDRAEEIAYWRNSILEKPVPVYGAPPSGADGRVPPRPVGSGQQDRIAPLAPAQTFDFGLESPEGEPVSLEQRVTTLEVKLFDFEYALAKLQGHDIPKPRLPSRPPKRPSIHELFPDSRTTPALTPSSSRETKQTLTRSFSRETNPTSTPSSSREAKPTVTPSSSREAKPTVTPSSSREVKPTLTPSSSRDQGEPAVPSTDEDEWTFRPQRWSKATSVTIRPPTAQRRPGGRRSGTPSPSSVRLAPDQFDALMALIDQEQSARQQMEMQIMDLRKEVEILRTPVYATIRSAYPTPSPESVHDPGRSTKPKRLHRTPAFQLHKDPHETSRFSMTDPDSEVSDANDGCEDVYETPQETRSISEMARGLPVAGMI